MQKVSKPTAYSYKVVMFPNDSVGNIINMKLLHYFENLWGLKIFGNSLSICFLVYCFVNILANSKPLLFLFWTDAVTTDIPLPLLAGSYTTVLQWRSTTDVPCMPLILGNREKFKFSHLESYSNYHQFECKQFCSIWTPVHYSFKIHLHLSNMPLTAIKAVICSNFMKAKYNSVLI